jgi:caspase domain-containing protein/SIR2-like protein
MLLLYFSGHGKRHNGDLLLCTRETAPCPGDPRQTVLTSTCVQVSDIKQAITTTRAKLVILIFDCCYSGQALGSFKGDDVSSLVWEKLGRPEGRYVITSSGMTQQSMELHEDSNSLFTKWLVRGLDTWEADLDHSGIIYLKELFDYIKTNVEKENPEQTPQYKGFGTNDLLIEIAHRPDLGTPEVSTDKVPIPFLGVVADAVESRRAIFFLGDGIYQDGPLSSSKIIEAIAKETESFELAAEPCLPTAAEHWQRYLEDSRLSFLRHFSKVLAEQEKQTTLPAIDHMLARMEPPWLAVSTTHDLLLERHLEDQNVPFVVVAHILNVLHGDDDPIPSGKILVMHRGREQRSEIVMADNLPDLSQDRVIYKVLGSPRLATWQNPPEGIDKGTLLDTVVATEDDHVTFVGNLRHEKTKIPTAFTLPFRQRAVVFLGYNLTTWHYRIVATIFSHPIPMFGRRQPYAVRLPKSPIEDLFWERLQARMIPIDPETFIRRLQQATATEG